MQTARERAEARACFDAHCDMAKVGYIGVEIIEGERVCFLYDAGGYCLVASRSGMVPLISYAINRDMTVMTVH